MIYLNLLYVICRGERIKEEWRTENGGITYVNECDGNDSTRCCGESTWIDVNTKEYDTCAHECIMLIRIRPWLRKEESEVTSRV
jgi:hypothetical protein